MGEEKKGQVKITIDIEMNEEIMTLAKEAIEKMPAMIPAMMPKVRVNE